MWAGSGGDRLTYLQWVSFTVRATATSVGSIAWDARAHRQQDCSGGGTALAVPPVVVVSAPAVTPTPVPTPTATATPRPTATPTPTAQPGESSPPPDSDPGLMPGAGQGAPAPGLEASPPPASTGAGSGSPIEPSLGGTAVDAPDANAPRIAFDETRVEVSLGAGGLLDGLGTWAVPAAGLAGPGLLILLWVAVQTAGALAWIPAVKRLRGKDAQPVT